MKKYSFPILLLFVSALFYSCANSNTESEQKQNEIVENLPELENETQEKIEEETEKQAYDSSFFNLPFGCPTLVNFVFSDYWNIIDRSGTIDMGHSVYQKALLDVNTCLHQINNRPVIDKPEIKSKEYVRYSEGASLDCNDANTTDSIIAKLSKFGKYDAYYAFGNLMDIRGEDAEFTANDCVEYGNLLLVDPETKIAKVLNVYLAKGDRNEVNLRLFYINKKEQINIMEVRCDSKFCYVDKRVIAEFDSSGDLKVGETQRFLR